MNFTRHYATLHVKDVILRYKAACELIHSLLQNDRCIQIKLLGDSITHGVGGTGWEENGEPIIEGFARSPHSHCWANTFKAFMESHYDATVINNGCSGTNIQFIIQNFDTLVDEQDDIVFCTIGTNNRHKFFSDGEKETREEYGTKFYHYVLELYDRFKAKNIPVVFIANIPAAASAELDGADWWRILHMDDINAIYKHASSVCGFPLISFYDLFNAYCEQNGKTVDSLLCDGLHPNDEGYDVMADLILDALQLR